MKSFLKILPIFFVCILISCGNSVLQSEKTDQTEKSKPIDFSLKMERTACLGNCPVYKLEVLQNGQLSFEQLTFSEKDAGFSEIKGKIEKTLSQEKVSQLIAEIDKANFFALSAKDIEAGNCATDHSHIILSIKLRGKEKKINHDLGCSGTEDLRKLESLEDKIDEIVETKRWIGEQE